MESSESSSNRKDPRWKYNRLRDPKDKNAGTCNFGERLQRVEFVGPNNIRLENLRTLRIVKSVPKCEGRISNYIMREVLRNVFPSLLDFGFDGDMIEIDDQDEQDDVGRRLIWKSSIGI